MSDIFDVVLVTNIYVFVVLVSLLCDNVCDVLEVISFIDIYFSFCTELHY